MKNTDFMFFYSRLVALANQGLVLSIEEMIEDKKLGKVQRGRIDELMEFAKKKYKAINVVEYDQNSDIA